MCHGVCVGRGGARQGDCRLWGGREGGGGSSGRGGQTSTLSGPVRSTSDFAGSVPSRRCFAPVVAHHDMTACLCVSLFIGRGVLDEHACSCLAQCNAFRAGAAPGRLAYSTARTRRPSLPPPRGGPGLQERNRKSCVNFHAE